MSIYNPHSTLGLITVATGDLYRQEVRNLITSLRLHSPNLELTIFTDQPFLEPNTVGVREFVIEEPTHTFFDKIIAIQNRPYARTLYVDSDTVIARDVNPIFELLEGCDVAAVHDSWRVRYSAAPPEVFPEPNCGVILLGESKEVELMVKSWAANYRRLGEMWSEGGSFGDQHPLWEVLWQMQCSRELRFLALPVEWNIHIWHPISLPQNAEPAIIHGRGRSLAQVGKSLSSTPLARVWIPNLIGWNGLGADRGVIFGDRLGNLGMRALVATNRLVRRITS